MLGLLGLGDGALDKEIDGFLLRSPAPNSTQVAGFLKLYDGEARNAAARRLVERGVPAVTVSSALSWLETSSSWGWSTIGGVLSVASAAFSGYHGYRRNNSIGWAIAWFTLGGIFPIFTPVVALAQGYGKRKGT